MTYITEVIHPAYYMLTNPQEGDLEAHTVYQVWTTNENGVDEFISEHYTLEEAEKEAAA